MKILVSNDDGYLAPGIKSLAQALSSLGEVTVIAPDRNRSGASNSLTLDRPLSVKKIGDRHYYVNGTPTDCVHLALSSDLLEDKPDIVVSGINHGSNLGDDVIYSGTVAAAMQGRFLGLPAVAVSLDGETHFETAAKVAVTLVKRLSTHRLPASTILNVNVPDLPLDQLEGYEIARLGTRYLAEKALRQINPRGHEVYWIGLPGPEQDAGPGTDFSALRNKRVAVTPLQLDWSHYTAFEEVSKWLPK